MQYPSIFLSSFQQCIISNQRNKRIWTVIPPITYVCSSQAPVFTGVATNFMREGRQNNKFPYNSKGERRGRGVIRHNVQGFHKFDMLMEIYHFLTLVLTIQNCVPGKKSILHLFRMYSIVVAGHPGGTSNKILVDPKENIPYVCNFFDVSETL